MESNGMSSSESKQSMGGGQSSLVSEAASEGKSGSNGSYQVLAAEGKLGSNGSSHESLMALPVLLPP